MLLHDPHDAGANRAQTGKTKAQGIGHGKLRKSGKGWGGSGQQRQRRRDGTGAGSLAPNAEACNKG